MMIGFIFIIVLVLIAFIWMFIEFKRLKHKLFAILLIGAILFFYFSAAYVFKGNNIDFKSISGVKEAGSLYFSWMISAFSNIKEITSNAINMDWGTNNSTG